MPNPHEITLTITYNGVDKTLQVQPHEQVTAVLHKAIALFHITQQPHLLSLFRGDNTKVHETQSVEAAGLTTGMVLVLRPDAVKGG